MNNRPNKRKIYKTYPIFHILKFVFQVGETVSGRCHKLFDRRNKTVTGCCDLALSAMVFQLLFNCLQSITELTHFFFQLNQTKQIVYKLEILENAGNKQIVIEFSYLTFEACFRWGKSSWSFRTSLNYKGETMKWMNS